MRRQGQRKGSAGRLPRYSAAHGMDEDVGRTPSRGSSTLLLVLVLSFMALASFLVYSNVSGASSAATTPDEMIMLQRATPKQNKGDGDNLAQHVDQRAVTTDPPTAAKGAPDAVADERAETTNAPDVDAGFDIITATGDGHTIDRAVDRTTTVAPATTEPEAVPAWEDTDPVKKKKWNEKSLKAAQKMQKGRMANRAMDGECIDVHVDGDEFSPEGTQSGTPDLDVVECGNVCKRCKFCEGATFHDGTCKFWKNIKTAEWGEGAGLSGTLFAHKFPRILVCPTGADLAMAAADEPMKLSIVERVLREAFPRAGAWLHAAADMKTLYDSHHGSLTSIWRSLHKHGGDKNAVMGMAPDKAGPQHGTALLFHEGDGSEVAEGQRLSGECADVAVDGEPLTGPGGTLPDASGLIFKHCASLCERSPACEAITHSLDIRNRCKLWRTVRALHHGSDRHFKHKSDMMHNIVCPSASDSFPIAMTPTTLAGTRSQQVKALRSLLTRLFKKRAWTAAEAEELYTNYHGDMVGIWKKLGIEHFADASQPLAAVAPGELAPPEPKLSFENEL